MTAPVLSRRALNRATLARQLLLERVDRPVADVVEHLGGLQAQTTHTWYAGLWCRLEPFDPEAAGQLLTDRALVRIGLQRSTIHLVTAHDARWIRPLLDPVLARTLSSFARHLDGLDQPAVAAAAGAILEAEPLQWAALGRRLQEDWPGRDGNALAQVARARLPLVQLPPRGVWGRSGQARHTTLEAWLGGSTAPRAGTVADLFLRYLAAFGPASAKDAQAWCGLTRMQAVADGLRDRLVTFTAEDGRELFDLPDAPRPEPGVPAPVRLLYDYDNLLLGHADRSRFHGTVPPGAAFAGVPPDTAPGAVLVDGVIRGSWLPHRDRTAAGLTVRTAGITPTEATAVEAEAGALLRFLAPEADPGNVRLVPV
ncbi:hypothetical protein DSM112329_04484 [Paraconexibacter sp. AEG42_29]|uniref:Winged helix DNA-binding domain-containing protein n=1 Tax=Paraconexibacter sp. AEG42_29 TaxID=2997339 RepID=A0AAU7B1V3_9ACTN